MSTHRATKQLLKSTPFQMLIALLLCANFLTNAWEAHMINDFYNADGSPSIIKQNLEKLDLFFTLSSRLVLNVCSSALGVRVLRIFNQARAIQSIIKALSNSIIPFLNAFFIMAIVVCLYAIIGVTFYSQKSQEGFGNLERSIISMFRIAAGETWVDGSPILRDDGTVDWSTAAFVMSFVIVVNWTLLKVSVFCCASRISTTSFQRRREIGNSKTVSVCAFSNILSIVTIHCKYTRALTFENVRQDRGIACEG